MTTFPVKLPGAKVVLTFNFANALNGANLTTVASLTVVATQGLDPTPTAILNGTATVSGTDVLQPVQGGVFGEQYLFTVLANTDNAFLVPEIQATLPVGLLQGPVSYNDPNFRAQFPAFSDPTAYPAASLQFAWNMGANWISQTPSCNGMSLAQVQQAADLMGAVVTYQLFGPASTSGGSPSYSQSGEAPGAVQSASEGSVSASFQLPNIGNSGFNSMLLASPPYGRMLLALLQVAASVGFYVPSGRFALVPP